MFRSKGFVWLLLGTLLLSGCSLPTEGSPVSQDQAPPQAGLPPSAGEKPTDEGSGASVPGASANEWQIQEIPFDYAAMKDAVVIRLDEEPRLQSPIRTVVGMGPQTFTLFFREAMDRKSVEEAIVAQAKEENNGDWFVHPDFEFRWVHDKQLHLRATPQEKVTGMGIEYRLAVNGARTKSGQVLAKSPDLFALVLPPNQVWRMSLDGQVREKLSQFPIHYLSEPFLDEEQRYLFLRRYTHYCECDGLHPLLYAIYDVQEKTMTHYPVELMTTYRGEGRFYVDRRGFFYAEPDKGVKVPEVEGVSRIEIDGYVHGASFSRDRSKLLMAVGTEEQKQDFDLLIVQLESGQQRRFAGVLKGTVPTSEMDGAVIPIDLQDDGKQVIIRMRKHEESFEELVHRFDWGTKTISLWNPPVVKQGWSGYLQTDDGMYQMFWNGGFYKGTTHVADFMGEGVWLPSSHRFLFAKYKDSEHGSFMNLNVFDADRNKTETLLEDLQPGLDILGVSRDSKWVYLLSLYDLQKPE
ncbi:hypothetical protein NDK47_10565 [Brevibacillus ruminantium]|uniref:SbsA Ig-like domain-containing protein n=1 Tax=Brevibacillus ruminantium TaxID=2950604 RepID=A0ABY4WQJ6_9BACL|nr:hypothetical protein [Brevibacillus ruminantium]USG67684.1 hypothetical protein NDK47_10565 [Brevibacillus ruminantium]